MMAGNDTSATQMGKRPGLHVNQAVRREVRAGVIRSFDFQIALRLCGYAGYEPSESLTRREIREVDNRHFLLIEANVSMVRRSRMTTVPAQKIAVRLQACATAGA
jgi:hypothetical protein